MHGSGGHIELLLEALPVNWNECIVCVNERKLLIHLLQLSPHLMLTLTTFDPLYINVAAFEENGWLLGHHLGYLTVRFKWL